MNLARSLGSGARVSTSGTAAKRAERVWQIFAVVSVAALSWWYIAAHRQPSANRYHGLVLGLGWIGMSLALLAAALSIRKRMAYQGAGKMSAWLSAHIYLGIVAAFAIFYHSGLARGRPAVGLAAGVFLAHRRERTDGLVVHPQVAAAVDRHRGEPRQSSKTCFRFAPNACKACSSWPAPARPSSAPWWNSA